MGHDWFNKRRSLTALVLMAGCAGSYATSAAAPSTPAASTDAQQAQASSAQDTPDKAGDSAKDQSSADGGQLQEVVVNGYAASLEKSIEYKFKASNITDSISAEGIGQFPEQNMAESLQRITGVQITRNQGEGQFISVRGLDPKFTDTLYNGRQLPSGSGTRAFDFQVLSGDFAQRVDVYKSPTADLPESGLAATVNVQSIRPLEFGQRKAVVTAEGLYDDQARAGVTPHLAGLYTDTFFDHRLGWIVAVDLNERNVDDQNTSSDGVRADSTYTGPGTAYRLFSVHLADQVGLDRRLSAMSTLEFKVNDNLDLTFDTLDSEFDQSYNWMQGDNYYPGAFALGPETTLSQTLDQNNVEVDWQGTNVFAWVQANRFHYNQRLTSNALSANWSLGNWTGDTAISFGQAREETTQIYVSWKTNAPGPTFSYNANPNSGGPISFSLLNYDPMNVANYTFFGVQGDYKEPTTDKIWNFKADATRDLDFHGISRVQLGAEYENRTLANSPNWISNTAAGFPADMSGYLMVDNNPRFFSSYGGSAQFPRTFLTANLDKFFGAFPLSGFIAANPPVPTLTMTTVVEEKSEAAYGQVFFGSSDQRFTGNFGVRLVRTEELSSGYVPAPDATLYYGITGGASSITYSAQGLLAQKNTYNNALPDLNATYKITDNLLARFAAAEVMQRPDMNLLGEASSPNSPAPPPPGSPWTGTLSEGNPNLKPYLAHQFDASLEWYFGSRSILAGDFFLKDVRNLVLTNYFNQTQNITLAGNLLNGSRSVGDVVPITFSVGQPQNAPATTLKGIEAAWEQPFTFLPGFLRYFGAQANYTHIWSQKVVLNEGKPALPVTGVSANTYNAGVYYDTGRFGVHANYNYRSEWVSDPLSFFGDGIFVKGYGQLDVSGSYNVTDWLTVSASVLNATQSALVQVDSYGVNRLYELPGRRFYFGLHATF